MSASGFIDARCRGFTLIEVMIAMFVIALFATHRQMTSAR